MTPLLWSVVFVISSGDISQFSPADLHRICRAKETKSTELPLFPSSHGIHSFLILIYRCNHSVGADFATRANFTAVGAD
jgi:hypothetical protein